MSGKAVPGSVMAPDVQEFPIEEPVVQVDALVCLIPVPELSTLVFHVTEAIEPPVAFRFGVVTPPVPPILAMLPKESSQID